MPRGHYPKGTIILFSEGVYSDFGYCGEVRLLMDLDVKKVEKEYRAAHVLVKQNEYDEPSQSGYVGWLIRTGIAEPLECQQVHLGDYNLEIDID